MKKYLFLFALFLVYIYLFFSRQTKPVISYNNENEYTVINYDLRFKNGINMYKFENILSNYKSELYIVKINNYNVSCNNINTCIKQIFMQEDTLFEEKYLASGFNIYNISLITDKEYFNVFLSNNINYN